MKIPFGSKVSTNYVLKRSYYKSESGNYLQFYWMKVKLVTPIENGIFLGERNISNGICTHDYETGTSYKPQKHLRVGLVCLTESKNPVYVYLEDIKVL